MIYSTYAQFPNMAVLGVFGREIWGTLGWCEDIEETRVKNRNYGFLDIFHFRFQLMCSKRAHMSRPDLGGGEEAKMLIAGFPGGLMVCRDILEVKHPVVHVLVKDMLIQNLNRPPRWGTELVYISSSNWMDILFERGKQMKSRYSWGQTSSSSYLGLILGISIKSLGAVQKVCHRGGEGGEVSQFGDKRWQGRGGR